MKRGRKPRILLPVPPVEPQVRVIRDTRDGSKDYFLPAPRAKELCDLGKIHRDLTNGCYGTEGDTVL